MCCTSVEASSTLHEPSCSDEGDSTLAAVRSKACARSESKNAMRHSWSVIASRWKQPTATSCTLIAIWMSSSPERRSFALMAAFDSVMNAFARKIASDKPS